MTQRTLTWSERRCITMFLTWGLVAMTYGQCELSAVHGQQFFDGYTPSGGVILRQYNDLTDTIVITVDGAVRETMQCVQHGYKDGSFTSYVFTKEVNNKTVYLCVQQYQQDHGLYYWQTPTNSSIDAGTCFTELRNKPKNTLFSIAYPFTLLDRKNCYAPVGLFHAVLDSTTSCADDVSSFVKINSTWMYTKTCLTGDNSYEYPHQANFSCYGRLYSYYLGDQEYKYITLVSIIINERRAFYCMSNEVINGQRAIQLLPQPETLNCSGDPTLTIFLLADQCDLGVCQNGGTCSQTPDTYTCQCNDGFIGHDCSIVDGCLSDPCRNGATCSSDVNGFSCICPSGYEGMRCETAAFTAATVSTVLVVCLLLIIIVICVLKKKKKKKIQSISAARGVGNTGASAEDNENSVGWQHRQLSSNKSQRGRLRRADTVRHSDANWSS